MRGSVFLRRIMILLVSAIVLTAALTMLFYSQFTSDIVYINAAQSDFRRKGSHLAEEAGAWLQGERSEEFWLATLEAAPEMLNATLLVSLTDAARSSPAARRASSFDASEPVTVYQPAAPDLDPAALEAIRARMQQLEPELLSGSPVQERAAYGASRLDALLAGYPISVYDPDTGRRPVLGAVYIVQSMERLRTGLGSFNFALIFASALAILLMLLPTWFAISRLTRPLKQVKDVATAMSAGNFSLRADTGTAGEIGELARAVNELAADLDSSIAALMQERNRLQQILDGLGEGIIAVDRELELTHINPMLAVLLGESGIEQLIRSGDFRQAMERRKPVTRSLKRNERVLELEITALEDGDHDVIGAVGLVRDITAAEQLEQTRRDYVANVSHELRTPLTALRALIEPLSDGLVSREEDRHRYYGIILNETLRLSRLIDDMLELSRLQAGRTAIRRTSFRLVNILDPLAERYRQLADEAGVTLHFAEFENRQLRVYSNADRIEQVLVILLDNALKFTPEGGEISLSVNDSAERVVITVRDSGIGMTAEDQQHAFDRFYKADKARGRGGTGLGLSIAREMMQVLGERIWVRSQPDQGSSFHLTITRAQSEIKSSVSGHSRVTMDR